MISLKLSRELQDAGLKWEPSKGDWFYWENRGKWNLDVLPARDIDTEFLDDVEVYGHVFCPRLDQLLQEIEARGWGWSLFRDDVGHIQYHINIYNSAGEQHELIWGATPEEAAAQALLWILKEQVSEQ